MVDRISGGSPLAREAILAALKEQARAAAEVQDRVASVGREAMPLESGRTRPATGGVDFAEALHDGVRAVQDQVQRAERLPEDVVAGRIEDFHEVAIQIKRADMSFRFALEIRNKLIDAYREVMRMSV